MADNVTYSELKELGDALQNQALRKWIDEASYEELFRKWRFTSIGDPLFQGEIGDYYAKVMQFLREQEGGQEEHIRSSKIIGWDK